MYSTLEVDGCLFIVKSHTRVIRSGRNVNDVEGMIDFNSNIVIKCVCLPSAWEVILEAGPPSLLRMKYKQ